MPEQPGEKLWTTVDRSQLAALIDKLVAVQLDLKPLCDPMGVHAPVQGHTEMTIGVACELLQSAIEDVRAMIYRLEDIAGERAT